MNATANSPFEAGRIAFTEGKNYDDNPHVIGRTKLGAIKVSEEGEEWERGRASVGKVASKKELDDAARYDLANMPAKRSRRFRA